MNRRARLRSRDSGQIFHLYLDTDPQRHLDAYEPDYTFTRLWMGIAPGETVEQKFTPGYCCIIGEKHTPGAQWDKGSFVLVDEAVALDPADFTDFTPQQLAQFDITTEGVKNPIQEDLRDAAIALKDLYKPELCWCVPDFHFMDYLRRGEGLSWYDYKNWHLWEHKFPLIKDRRNRVPQDPYTVGIVGNAPQIPPEDRAYGIAEVYSLLVKKRLEICRHNRYDEVGHATEAPSLFRDRREQWPSIHRAVSWVLFNMRHNPRPLK